jgi:hypothetical protein
MRFMWLNCYKKPQDVGKDYLVLCGVLMRAQKPDAQCIIMLSITN